ncbi:MAG: ABC transporter permease [Anaerolineae bacterium]|nr:ABC transporter permease [Chloroflexota bacterium]MBN8635116.1 ABC transporter permease [Anaerolineae bacterium]
MTENSSPTSIHPYGKALPSPIIKGTPQRNTPLRRFLRNPRAVFGLILLVGFVLIAVFAPVIAPFEPDEQFVNDRLLPPNSTYVMGVDGLGRDVFSRALYSAQISIPIGIFAMLVSILVGVTIGLLAGYLGGWVDVLLMRLTDMLLAFPVFFLLLTVTTLFGRTIPVLILVLGLTSWGVNARIVRGQVLALREKEFVEAARSLGAGNYGIIWRHIFPNIVPLIIVDATLRIALVILIEGGLSFLGVGVQPPTPSWGSMVAEGGTLLRRAWWVSVFPGAFLFLCTISFNLVGDGLRDALDPRMKQ